MVKICMRMHFCLVAVGSGLPKVHAMSYCSTESARLQYWKSFSIQFYLLLPFTDALQHIQFVVVSYIFVSALFTIVTTKINFKM